MTDPLIPCLVAAYALDLLLGDPRWLPHPVRLIGLAARLFESVLTSIFGRTRFAGLLFAAIIVGGSFWVTWALVRAATQANPWAGFALTTYLLFTSFAARDLHAHASRIAKALDRGDLPAAREKLSMIVGRDTDSLDERQVVRAALESVGESTLDGVVAPLFFAAIGGAPAAIAYKAANTLDSLVGHKTERYLRFGWASARLDDALNWIPARLATLIYPAAALLVGLPPKSTWSIARRDGAKSPSPNAGISEAALAGALGVQLGGTNTYEGVPEDRPFLGDPGRPLEKDDIRRSVAWMYASSVLALIVFGGVRAGALHLWTLRPGA